MQEFYNNLIRAIPNPACILSRDMTVLFANEPFYSFSGVDINTLPVKNFPINHYLTIQNGWENDEVIERPFKKGKPGIHNNIHVKNNANSSVTVSLRTVPCHNESREVECAILIIRDREGTGYKNEKILDLIEKQERKLKELNIDGDDPQLTNNQLKELVTSQRNQLIEADQTLQVVKEEMNDELEMAKNVQNSLMPRTLPDFTNISISSIYIPAGKVGGDFYDIISTQTQKIAVLIFDVSGHGVPAALIGATAKMLFAHYIEMLDSPSKIFNEVNKKLCSFLQTDHYLTAFLGILDPIQNTMVYSRAGHVKPIVYHSRQKKVSTLDSRGSFIGHAALADIAEYHEGIISFEPSDKILFYTDGLTEGCNAKSDLYGKDRLMRVFKRYGDSPLDEVLDKIIEDQELFREGVELRDDFTMLCIKVDDSSHLLKGSGFTKKDAPNILIINRVEEIGMVCLAILRAMDHSGFSDIEIKRMKVCIFEMIINAIAHGNKNAPDKKVLILYKVIQDKVTISIVDDGEGFDYENLPNPLDKENLLKDHGRGVYIVKNYMDEVHFNEKGNRILVVKYHEG
jgi:serine phosphatase RsbU (regulator of sigma subunit)/anti-sigma regulatory factor (Ser/Thr protein kinase)